MTKGWHATHLGGHAEDVRVVLNEPPHAREARERTRCLVSVNDTELSHTNGELLV